MTRAEYVEIVCTYIAAGRLRNYPDMRRSEAAAARVNDQKMAMRSWKGNRANFASMTPDELKAKMGMIEARLENRQTKE